VQNIAASGGKNSASIERYLLEILWREFSWHLLHQFPALPEKPLVNLFEKFPWHNNPDGLKAWQKGMTGYPIVDAGMRQLWQTGWMHNRVRMVVASFLIKHLLIDWREGEAWFWDTLVDADLGSNSASWQWVAGCGADAAPFFRIFNPMLQGKKFDPYGDYVKNYVPELAQLDAQYIHEPWNAPPDKLKEADISLDSTYPLPIVDHDAARKRALAALKSLKDPRAATIDSMDLFDT
jgi:deoxyribodipyrimidine photo-lyase